MTLKSGDRYRIGKWEFDIRPISGRRHMGGLWQIWSLEKPWLERTYFLTLTARDLIEWLTLTNAKRINK